MRRIYWDRARRAEDFKIQRAKERAAKEQRLTRAVASTIPDKPVYVSKIRQGEQ